MGFKKSEIAAKVLAVTDALPLAPLEGGGLQAHVTDLASLGMVPWFCDVSIQWTVRITSPGQPLTKKWIPKVANTFVLIDDGRFLVGVPGDGIEPSTYTLTPLGATIGQAATPGMTMELATANLGTVKRDLDAKADTRTTDGNQRYSGTVGADGVWTIERSSPAVSRGQLETAIDCGSRFVRLGPWDVKDTAEAEAIVKLWVESAQANINPNAITQLWTLNALRFEDAGGDEQRRRMGGGLDRKLYGLALGYFRHRLAGGPFRWNEAPAPWLTAAEVEDVLNKVVRHRA
jgi:hypothetical protein